MDIFKTNQKQGLPAPRKFAIIAGFPPKISGSKWNALINPLRHAEHAHTDFWFAWKHVVAALWSMHVAPKAVNAWPL